MFAGLVLLCTILLFESMAACVLYDSVYIHVMTILLGVLSIVGCQCTSPTKICISFYQVSVGTTDKGSFEITLLVLQVFKDHRINVHLCLKSTQGLANRHILPGETFLFPTSRATVETDTVYFSYGSHRLPPPTATLHFSLSLIVYPFLDLRLSPPSTCPRLCVLVQGFVCGPHTPGPHATDHRLQTSVFQAHLPSQTHVLGFSRIFSSSCSLRHSIKGIYLPIIYLFIIYLRFIYILLSIRCYVAGDFRTSILPYALQSVFTFLYI